MEKIIKVDGKSLHLILGKSIYEWCELFGSDIDLWNMPLDELLDGTLDINEDIWYYYIDGRCYETNREILKL